MGFDFVCVREDGDEGEWCRVVVFVYMYMPYLLYRFVITMQYSGAAYYRILVNNSRPISFHLSANLP